MTAALHVARRVSWTLAQVILVAWLGLGLADLVEHRELGTRVVWRLVLVWRDLAPLILAAGAALAVARLRAQGDLLGLVVSGVGAGAVAAGVTVPALVLGAVLGGVVELAAPAALEATASSEERQVSGAWMQAPEGFVRVDEDQLVLARVVDGQLVERVTWSQGEGAHVSVPELEASLVAEAAPVDSDQLSHRAASERGAAELDGSWLRHRMLAPIWSAALAVGLAGLGLGLRLAPSWTMGTAGLVAAGLVLLGLVTAPTAGAGWLPLALAVLSCLSWTRPLYWTSR